MIRLGLQKEVDEYFTRSEVSQSFLKALCKGVAFTHRDEKEMYYEEKGHLVIGSAVDDKISMGEEAFKQKYFTSEKAKPSDAVMSMVQQVFDHTVEVLNGELPPGTLHDYGNAVLDSANDHKYQLRWKEPTRISKVQELGFEYFEELKEAFGKQILSVIENTIVNNIEMSWRTHPYTAQYFNHQADHIHIFYQVPIYFECMNVDCKCLLDVVIVNTKANTIQPIDFKTTGDNPIMFPKSVGRFGYNFQASFYTEGLKALVLGFGVESIPELMAVTNSDTEILPFKFMVESTEHKVNKITEEVTYYQGSPLMYTLSSGQIDLGKYGRPELHSSTHSRASNAEEALRPVYPIIHREILGFIQALDLVIWHSFNGFEVDKKVVEAEGDILI